MADSGFRATQPPSKVLHIRNLPFEAQEDELLALCSPFGKTVKTKLNVGPSKNQAFVEFADQGSAINMISYYSGSAEPAKVRGKTVYLQYSTRQEIVNSTGQGEHPSNVLLVTMDLPVTETNVTLDILHLVFSTFGFVHKIATFEKAAGFQALVQYGDNKTAEEARDYLDGRMIPKDFTNPYLPVATTAADSTLTMADPINPTGPESNVLLAQIDNVGYPVVVDALYTVFSPYGYVQKIAIFEKNGQWQALVQYSDQSTAAVAKEALEGHAIYDGGYNKLKLSYSVHRELNVKTNNERGWDYTQPAPHAVPPAHAYGATPAAAASGYHPVTAMMLPPEVVVTGQDYEDAHARAVAYHKEAAESQANLAGPGHQHHTGPHYSHPHLGDGGSAMQGPPGHHIAGPPGQLASSPAGMLGIGRPPYHGPGGPTPPGYLQQRPQPPGGFHQPPPSTMGGQFAPGPSHMPPGHSYLQQQYMPHGEMQQAPGHLPHQMLGPPGLGSLQGAGQMSDGHGHMAPPLGQLGPGAGHIMQGPHYQNFVS